MIKGESCILSDSQLPISELEFFFWAKEKQVKQAATNNTANIFIFIRLQINSEMFKLIEKNLVIITELLMLFQYPDKLNNFFSVIITKPPPACKQ